MTTFEFNPAKKLQSENEKAQWRLKAYDQYVQELLSNPEFHEYCKQFRNPDRAEDFAKDYAHDKVRWMEWGPKYKEWRERDDMEWVNDAFKRLGEIQQKKLFDQQCLWRAEKIELPGIEICYDFYVHENNILNCRLVDPIAEEEVDMYMQYLGSLNFEFEQGWFDRWQDYEAIKEAYLKDAATRNVPDWYEFYNGRTGKGIYLSLPDIRGEKEEFYRSLYRKEFRKKAEEMKKQIENDPHAEKRPYLNYHGKGFMAWFVKTFDNKETQEKYEAFGGEVNWEDYDEVLEKNLSLLERACMPLPVQGWFDWREAIQRTADNYRLRKIKEAMPAAFDQYKIQLGMGIPFDHDNAGAIESRNTLRDHILRGRELNGEPRDLNF